MGSKSRYDQANHEFYELIGGNDSHSLIGKFPDGDYDDRGRPFCAVRAVAVNLHSVQDILLGTHVKVVGTPETGMALLQGPRSGGREEIQFAYAEVASAMMPTPKEAALVAVELLSQRYLKPDFPVAGVVVLIGVGHCRRFWIGFDPTWPLASVPAVAVEIKSQSA